MSSEQIESGAITTNSLNIEPPSSATSMGENILSRLARYSRKWYVKASAAIVWAGNASYYLAYEKPEWWRAVLQGPYAPTDTPLFSTFFDKGPAVVNALAATTQFAMVPISVGVGVLFGARFLDYQNRFANGLVDIKDRGIVILGRSEGALPLYPDLARELRRRGRVCNTVLAITAVNPRREPEEEREYETWAANRGERDPEYFNYNFWDRAGAKNASVIVLNSESFRDSGLAARGIRRQLNNTQARIIVVGNRGHHVKELNFSGDMQDFRDLDLTLVSPYVEVAKRILEGIKVRKAETFMPPLDPTLGDWHMIVERTKRLQQKLDALPLNEKLRVFIFRPQVDPAQLKDTREEFEGYRNAFNLFKDQCVVVQRYKDAHIALYFGSDILTRDSTVTRIYPDDPYLKDTRKKVIRIFATYGRRNMRLVESGDGAVSMRAATNDRLADDIIQYGSTGLSLRRRLGTSRQQFWASVEKTFAQMGEYGTYF